MRTAAGNWLGRIVISVLFGFLILSFGIWGIADIFRGYGTNTVAKVGSTEIEVETLRRAYIDEIQRLSRQARRPITNEQARAFGVDRQVLQRLVSEAVLDQAVRKMGLSVSDDTVARSLLTEPAFKGADGKFSRDTFNEYLRQTGYSETVFLRQQAQAMARQQLVEGIGVAPTVPGIWLDALNRYRAETRDISYFVLPAASVGAIAPPDDKTLESFFDGRKAEYRAPEYRHATLLALLPQDFAADVTVTEEDLRKAYDEGAKAGRFGAPEKRTIEQIVFPNEAEANAASVRLAAGTAFETLVQERKLKEADITLGTKSKAEIFDPAVAEAAFSLPEGGSSAPVKGQFGPVIVHVSKIEPGQVKPFEAVKDSLRSEVAARKLATDKNVAGKVSSLRDKIEDQRASGKSLTEIAKDLKLTVKVLDGVDAGGHDKKGQPIPGIPDQPEVLKAIFASDVGVDNEPVSTRDGGSIWYEVNAIDPSRDRSFAEVKPQVTAAWEADQAAKQLAAKGLDSLKALRGGQSMEDQANWVHGKVETAAGLSRGKPGALGQAVLTAVFGARLDAYGEALAANGQDRIIFQLKAIKVPPLKSDDPASEPLRKQLVSAYTEDILTQYVAHEQAEMGLTVNDRAFRLATGGVEN